MLHYHIAFSGIGKRERQEDAFQPDIQGQRQYQVPIAVVCDGVGGVPFGHEASRITAKTIYEYFQHSLQVSTSPLIDEAVQYAAQHLLAYKLENIYAMGMNTTMCACFLPPTVPNIAYLYHIGDSKIFHLRQGELRYESVSHNLYNAYLNDGWEVNPDNKKLRKLTRVIKPYNPENPQASADTHIVDDLQAGDCIILCSDGVLEANPVEQLRALLAKTDLSIEEKANILCKNCEENSMDNFTAILIVFEQAET